MSDDQGGKKPKPEGLPPSLTYDVGYGKPPTQKRFKPGQSGNPRGRPKAQASMAQSLSKAVYRNIKITESGAVKSITALDAMMLNMTTRALRGDMQAMKLLTNLMADYKVSAEPQPARELIIRFVEPDAAKIAEWEKES